MKYLPACLAMIFGCFAVTVAIYVTGNPVCLFTLLLVGIVAQELYP